MFELLKDRANPMGDLGEFFDNRFREFYQVDSIRENVNRLEDFANELAEEVGADMADGLSAVQKRIVEAIKANPEFEIEKYRKTLAEAVGEEAAAIAIMTKIGAVLNRKNKQLLDTAINAMLTIRKNSSPAEEEEKGLDGREEQKPGGDDVDLNELQTEANEIITAEEYKKALQEALGELVGSTVKKQMDKARGKISFDDE